MREQANINVFKEKRAHIAEKQQKQLKKIEDGPGAEEQRQQARPSTPR